MPGCSILRPPRRTPVARWRYAELFIEATNTRFAIGWMGHHPINRDSFVFIDSDTARVTTTLGYPARHFSQLD